MRTAPVLLLSVCVLATSLVMAAGSAHGQSCPDPPSARSFSRVCAGVCVDSGTQTGNPAESSRSDGYTNIGTNLGASAALTIDTGYFSTSTYVGGMMPITATASNDARANTTGDVFDCLTMEGSTGPAWLHVPIQVQGSSNVSWSIAGAYEPPPGFDVAGSTLSILCTASAEQQDLPCDDPTLAWTESDTIDTVVELVVPFTFGAPVTLHFGPRMISSMGYAANGGEGSLEGMVDLAVDGLLLPAYVKDLGGSLLPAATVAAGSGFDYLHPAPEPDAAVGGLAAVASVLGLAASRRARRRFPTSGPA
jgi:hypothetical protein